MKTIIQYQCDICHSRYNSEDSAKACESNGYFNPEKFPAGLMFEYYHHDFVGIFSIPEPIKIDNHFGRSGLWACRKFCVDTLGEQKCGDGGYMRSDEESINQWIRCHMVHEHLNSPEFERMVAYLRSQGITPSYYDKDHKLVVLN